MAIVYLGIAVLAYLIGALPIGGMVAGLKRIDIRQHGSGKLGTHGYRLSVRIPHGVRHGDWLHVDARGAG